ncbi:MAG TPA: hypothetical protein VHE55_09010 [Fimbriimonadaceae bacterium]|nr:hypothetical protein [Fimbriimonadaceae bacterium]
MAMASQLIFPAARVGTGCRYEFDVKKRPGEKSRVVINCYLPSGHCSRMTVEEEDWPAFVSGFLEAVEAMSDRYDPLTVSC